MSEKEVQPDATESQSTNTENKQDFIPEKTVDEYAEKWRLASAEAQKHRKEKAALKAELEKRDAQKLEEQGKFKDMYEKSRDELQALRGGLEKGMKRSALAKELIAQGCTAKMVDKAIKHAELGGIETDPENYSPNSEQIKFEAKRIKEEVPVFFGKGLTEPKDGVPGSSKPGGKRNVKALSNEDLAKLYAEALKPT